MTTTRDVPEGMSPSPFLEEEYMVAKSDAAFVRLNVFPATHNGHLLFIPNDTNAQTPFQMSEQELKEVFELMKQAPKAIERSLPEANQPEGYTIGWNVGLAGGQSIAHAHAHIYGRKEGDGVAEDGSKVEVRGGIVQVLHPTDTFYHGSTDQTLEPLRRDKILMENDLAVVVPSPHPVTDQHVLVLPKRDVQSYHDLSTEEQVQMVLLAKQWLQEKHGLDAELAGGEKGADIGWNVGKSAGQVYTSSAAMEVVPRTLGDVEHARGGIAKIKPPADEAYYRGEKTGVSVGNDGQTGTADLEEERELYYKDLVEKTRNYWPKEKQHMATTEEMQEVAKKMSQELVEKSASASVIQANILLGYDDALQSARTEPVRIILRNSIKDSYRALKDTFIITEEELGRNPYEELWKEHHANNLLSALCTVQERGRLPEILTPQQQQR